MVLFGYENWPIYHYFFLSQGGAGVSLSNPPANHKISREPRKYNPPYYPSPQAYPSQQAYQAKHAYSSEKVYPTAKAYTSKPTYPSAHSFPNLKENIYY